MKKHTRLRRWVVRAALWVGGLALLILLAVFLHTSIAADKLESVLAQMEKDSIPLSWSEYLQQFPNVELHLAAQSNLFAALDAVAALPDLTDEQRELLPIEGDAETPALTSNVPPGTVAALDARVRDATAALAAVNDAVAADPFWLVPPKGSQIPMPFRWSSLRRAARLYKMSAILHSERGEAQAAIGSVLDGLRLAEVPHRGSLMIDELVRFACEGLAVGSLEYVLAKTDPPRDALRELASLLSEHDDMRTGFLGEIVYTKQLYESMPDVSRSDLKAMLELSDAKAWQYVLVSLPNVSGWMRMNEVYHLDLLHHVAAAWTLPWDDFTNRYTKASAAVPSLYFLPNTSEGAYLAVKNRELRAAGAYRCGRIATAVELYSREHAGLPQTLADLVPRYLEKIPVEPFRGKPFGYERDGEVGTLSFAYPDSEDRFTFTVLAGRETGGREN